MDSIRKNIDMFKNWKPILTENSFASETPTFMKLIRTAERDGHITQNEMSAQYIVSASKKIAEKWDVLHPEEKKVFRDKFYKDFLTLIGK